MIKKKKKIVGHDDYISKWHIKTNTLNYILETENETNSLLVTDYNFFSGHNNSYFKNWNLNGD